MSVDVQFSILPLLNSYFSGVQSEESYFSYFLFRVPNCKLNLNKTKSFSLQVWIFVFIKKELAGSSWFHS